MNKKLRQLIGDDMYRSFGKRKIGIKIKLFKLDKFKRQMILFRKAQYYSTHKFLGLYYKIRYLRMMLKTDIYIPLEAKIGRGFKNLHSGYLCIANESVLGDNITIGFGVTIGRIREGGNKVGCPTIGSNVFIGANVSIVGKVTIGSNVIIAPNTYINHDVPSNSICFGNPCIIKEKKDKINLYIYNPILLDDDKKIA